MKFMATLASVLLLAAVANPDTASCRVNARPTDWSETRTMLPTAGTPTALHIEACVFFEQTDGFEQTNPLNLIGCRWGITNIGIIVDVSFDPTFAPGFEVVPSTTIMLPDVGGRVGPYDGVFDFAGTSGQMIHQETQMLVTADLAIADPTFFQSPWPIYLRTRTLPYVQHSSAGSMAFQMMSNAGVGVFVTYQ